MLRVSVANVISQMATGAIISGRMEDESVCRVLVTGGSFEPAQGEVWQVSGEWRTSSAYGRQLHCRADDCRRALPSGALIAPWLQKFPGIGPERAQQIVHEFQGDLERAFGGDLSVDQLAAVIAPERPNLGGRLAAAIMAEWSAVKAEFETVRWLEEHGVEDFRLAISVAQLLGPSAIDIMSRNPYVLAAVLPWRKVDGIGRRILRRSRTTADATTTGKRVVGAIDDALRAEVERGHTAISRGQLPASVAARTNNDLGPDFAALVEHLGTANGAITPTDRNPAIWRAPGCAIMEDELERRFVRIVSGEEASHVTVPCHEKLLKLMHLLQAQGQRLHPEQKEAVLALIPKPLACLVGGAGTGKTTTLRSLVSLFEALGGRVEIAALAGKAALRASESTGRRAWTIHRLLEGLRQRRDAVAKGKDAKQDVPLLDDRTLLIIDEASMVDLGQWHAILEAMPIGCRLLMCGDTMQLPPIGFGLVFHHLANLKEITAQLTTIHRQSGASGIPHVSDAIRRGLEPPLKQYEGLGSGVSFYAVETGRDCADLIEQVVTDLGGFGVGEHALQIIAPLNEQGKSSVAALNRRFHDCRLAACDSTAAVVKGHLGEYFAVGDPVTHLSNDYAKGLWNGSLGYVVAVNTDDRSVTVDFGDARHQFSKSELIRLGLAYAITCHRAQGSSARRVIIPITETRLLDPSWIYTAITRAEEQAVLIGARSTLEAALRRQPASQIRITGSKFEAIEVLPCANMRGAIRS